MVSSEHTHKILTNFKAKYDKVIISENHNAPRSRETLRRIFSVVEVARENGEAESKGGGGGAGNSKGDSNNRRRRSVLQRDMSLRKGSRGINIVSREKSMKGKN